MASGVNIAMLPEEHADFWTYLATTGDIWAMALADSRPDCEYKPGPPAQFVKRFARKIQRYDCVALYLGHVEAILKPRFRTISTTVAGRKMRRQHLDYSASQLIRYEYGIINRDNVMNRTTASFHSTYLNARGNQFKRHPDEFLKWGKKVLAWLRRRIAGNVPVYRCHYEIPASALAVKAVKAGLKVV